MHIKITLSEISISVFVSVAI